MWNGGETFGKQDNYNRMWRESEDYLDLVDIEKEIEGDKVKDNINNNMDKPATISGGDPIRKKKK
tara:strand:- start:271 stop:465 length:195 start_codon:yes stop_codon:yes gene_type:complete